MKRLHNACCVRYIWKRGLFTKITPLVSVIFAKEVLTTITPTVSVSFGIGAFGYCLHCIGIRGFSQQ